MADNSQDRSQALFMVDQAKANLATAQAGLEKTNNDVARYQPLFARQAVSKQELDNALSAQQAARAQVDAHKAAVAQAQLDLGYTNIASPVDGVIGTTQRKVGSLVDGVKVRCSTSYLSLTRSFFAARLRRRNISGSPGVAGKNPRPRKSKPMSSLFLRMEPSFHTKVVSMPSNARWTLPRAR